MLNFSNTPPDDHRGQSLPIRRTPASKPLVAIVTSDDLTGTYTHYWKGHTTPCTGQDCEPCQNGMPYRWHAYLSAVDFQSGLHFLFETTAQAAEHFVEYRNAHGTLRGCCFQARRLNNRPNGRVLIQTKSTDLTQHAIPKQPDVHAALAILWSLPLGSVHAPDRSAERDTPKAATDGNHRPVDPPRILENITKPHI